MQIFRFERKIVKKSAYGGRKSAMSFEKTSRQKRYTIPFEKNVKMIDSEYNKLTSENLDMLISEDYAAAYDNVTLTTMNGQFVIADKIKFDSIKKTFKISMLEKDKKIKVKLIK